MTEETNYRMCHAYSEWLNYMKDTYERVSRETGAKILYVDEFSVLEANSCYSKDHGHEVPLNLIKADNNFIKTIRDVVPEETVLYGEFPPVDINSQFIDCNISYYICDMVVEMIDEQCDTRVDGMGLAPVCFNLYRYMFPGIVQLILPAGVREGSWNPLKFIFFNGEAIYDSFWDIEESRAHEFMLKAYDIKKKYVDCFTSGSPEMLVQTEKNGICANKFPGNGRTVWTLYNRRYTTVCGELISIVHKEGAAYYDVWNEQLLTPRIVNGRALIYLELPPQSIGCIARFDE